MSGATNLSKENRSSKAISLCRTVSHFCSIHTGVVFKTCTVLKLPFSIPKSENEAYRKLRDRVRKKGRSKKSEGHSAVSIKQGALWPFSTLLVVRLLSPISCVKLLF